jgi:hypothetical protein
MSTLCVREDESTRPRDGWEGKVHPHVEGGEEEGEKKTKKTKKRKKKKKVQI